MMPAEARVKMQLDPEDLTYLANTLERQVVAQGEVAKRAIREYKKTILHETTSGVRQIEIRREIEQAVNQYMQLRRAIYIVKKNPRTTSTPLFRIYDSIAIRSGFIIRLPHRAKLLWQEDR